ELELLAVQVALRLVEQLLGLAVLARDAREREPAALPELVVVDLGDRDPEPVLELRLRRLDELPLALQRPGLREVQLDGEDAHVPRPHPVILPAWVPRPTATACRELLVGFHGTHQAELSEVRSRDDHCRTRSEGMQAMRAYRRRDDIRV